MSSSEVNHDPWYDGFEAGCEFEVKRNDYNGFAKLRNEWIFEQIERHFNNNVKLIALCPFHKERTPSCLFEPLKNEFYCFSCGEKGDSYKLAVGICNMDDQNKKVNEI